MTIEVFYNPVWTIVQMLIFLVCVTAVTFIAILLLCGLRPEDIEAAEEA